MNDFEMDRLVRLSQPTPVPADALAEAGRDLLEEIMAESRSAGRGATVAVQEISTVRDRRRSGKLRWVVGVAAAVVFILAITLPTILFRADDSGAPVAPEPTVTLVDSGNPHLWVTDPDWKVARLGESAGKNGFIEFKRKSDGATLSISWDPVSEYDQHVQDQPFGKPSSPTTFLGRDAELFASGTGFFEKLVKYDEILVSVFARRVTRPEFDALAGQLHEMPAQQWLDGLPASVIRPDDSLAWLEQNTADIPLPEGFDLTELAPGFPLREVHLRSRVLLEVSCAWLDAYDQAYQAGDDPGMSAAYQVLDGSAEWSVAQDEASDYVVRLGLVWDRMAGHQDLGDYAVLCGD